MRSVMGSQVNRLWLPAAASMGMATHAVSMETDSTHSRSMSARYGSRAEAASGRGEDTRRPGEDRLTTAFSSARYGGDRGQLHPSQWDRDSGQRRLGLTRPPSPWRRRSDGSKAPALVRSSLLRTRTEMTVAFGVKISVSV